MLDPMADTDEQDVGQALDQPSRHLPYVYSPLPVTDQREGLALHPLLESIYYPGGRTVEFMDYKPGIRLITLHASRRVDDPIRVSITIERDLLLTRPYAAVSYVWGAAHDRAEVLVGDRALSITRNLHTALARLRLPYRDRTLWADGVCINQADTDEREQQVRVMTWIYLAASEVLVWLGDEDAADALALPLVSFVEERMCARGLGDEADWTAAAVVDAVREATHLAPDPGWALVAHVGALLRRPYFGRMWVLQEVANGCVARAGGPEVLCGPHSASWRAFARLVALRADVALRLAGGLQHGAYMAFAKSSGTLAVAMMNTLRRKTALHTRADGGEGDGDRDGEGLGLYDLLLLTSGRDATEPRDKVFALLGLPIRPGSVLPIIDYKTASTDEVFRRFVVRDIEINRSLRALSWAGLGDFDGRLTRRSPSWVPDWGVCGPAPIFMAQAGSYGSSASGPGAVPAASVSGDGRIVRTWGRRVGTITRLTPRLIDLRAEHGVPLEPELDGWAPTTAGGDGDNDDDGELDMARLRLDAALFGACYRVYLESVLPEGHLERRAEEQADGNGQFRLWIFVVPAVGLVALLRAMAYDHDEFRNDRFREELGHPESLFESEESSNGPMMLAFRRAACLMLAIHDREDQIVDHVMSGARASLAEAIRVYRARVHPPEWSRFCLIERRVSADETGIVTDRIVGWSPGGAQIGDTIVVLQGATVPFALRPFVDEHGREGWQLIGECWVDGFMDGEIMADGESPNELFMIM